jgi:hypothetical protein
MSKRMSDDSGWTGLITEMSSLTLRVTTSGDSWTSSALVTRMGGPTNSGRSCINIFRPKKPMEIVTQLNKPAVMGAASGLLGKTGGIKLESSPPGEFVAFMVQEGWLIAPCGWSVLAC